MPDAVVKHQVVVAHRGVVEHTFQTEGNGYGIEERAEWVDECGNARLL